MLRGERELTRLAGAGHADQLGDGQDLVDLLTRGLGFRVFAYGSLLNPGSLAATLPQLTPERCLPATCAGLRRVYGVAFPNDGSQDDKAYTDAAGVRSPARATGR